MAIYTRLRDYVLLQHANEYGGKLTDATQAVLSNAGGTAGIEDSGGNAVVAAGTPLERFGVGLYRYKFRAPKLGDTYTAHFQITQPDGRVDQWSISFSVPAPHYRGQPYIAASDLKTGVTWIDDLLDTGHGQTDYSAQLVAAREWLDGVILARVSPTARQLVRQWLDEGRLIVTPEVVAQQRAQAVALILRGSVGEPGDKFDRMADYYEREAARLAKRLVIELDLTGDGQPDKRIDLRHVQAGVA